MKKIITVIVLTCACFLLASCNSAEKQKIEQEVIDYKPMKTYTEGRAEEYVVEKKTAEEIASEVFKEQIGITSNTETSFLISGNLDSNLFVKALVSDGDNVPTLTGLSDDAIDGINSTDDEDAWAEDNATDYNSLITKRTVTVQSLNGNSEQKLSTSIQDAINYQEKIADK